MPSDTPDRDSLAEARRLETEAIGAGENTPPGRELRRQAAALRVQALGERIYPVLVCESCFAITGWRDGDGHCDFCVRQAQLHAAYSDPHGGWVVLGDARPSAARPKPAARPLRSRLSSLTHPREEHRHAVVQAWMAHVRPGETGPIEPEDGYELELARREELEAADRTGMVVRFHTATQRFDESAWVELETTRIAQREIVVPHVFPAALAVEAIVEAWGDYKAATDAFNRLVWSAESDRREAQRQAEAEHKDVLRAERDVVDLLDED